jgi:cytochrome bd-type quinol oxidase subunit 2
VTAQRAQVDTRRLALWLLVCLDALLLLALVCFSIGHQRLAFGRATGLVTTCESGVGHGMNDTWSPLVLLIVGLAAILTFAVAWRQSADDTLGVVSMLVAGALIVVAVALVAIPFGGTCVT